MNLCSNLLREQVWESSRIQYTPENGGRAPGMEPGEASVSYCLSAGTKDLAANLLERVENIAKGAALMTCTEMSSEILSFVYETLPNDTLNDIMYKNMGLAGAPEFSESELELAEELVHTLEPDIKLKSSMENLDKNLLIPSFDYHVHMMGNSVRAATDLGDVSWITPIGRVMTVCAPFGVQDRSWQAAASYGSSIGFKGMHLAAKTMALSIFDLLTDPGHVLKARMEFMEATAGKSYVPGIPAKLQPPTAPKPILELVEY